MANSNHPFKRPKMSDEEEYIKLPPSSGKKGKKKENKNIREVNLQPGQQSFSPPTQEELQWAINLEENVQVNGYKPSDEEMAKYQDISQRLAIIQQNNIPQKPANQPQNYNKNETVPKKKKNRFLSFLKFIVLISLIILFWAKASILVLQPSSFIPKGKVYILIKPKNFSKVFYSINIDKVIEKKLKDGFKKEDLNLENNQKEISKSSEWYLDPQYWETNFIISFPYYKPKLDF